MTRYRCHYKQCIMCSIIPGCLLIWFSVKNGLFRTTTRTDEYNPGAVNIHKEPPLQPPYPCKDRRLSLSEKPIPLIAIASFPECGAEWIQDLLQKVTGIVTGNTFCKDLGEHFILNCLQNRHVLTHSTYVPWTDTTLYKKAVIIIRSPYTAITAEFNSFIKRNTTKKLPISSNEYKKKLAYFTKPAGDRWIRTYDSWLNFTGETEIIFYDELLSNPKGTIKKILKFANINETELQPNCFDEVSWEPDNKETIDHTQLAMISLDIRKDLEHKIVKFEKRILEKRKFTYSLKRDV